MSLGQWRKLTGWICDDPHWSVKPSLITFGCVCGLQVTSQCRKFIILFHFRPETNSMIISCPITLESSAFAELEPWAVVTFELRSVSSPDLGTLVCTETMCASISSQWASPLSVPFCFWLYALLVELFKT